MAARKPRAESKDDDEGSAKKAKKKAAAKGAKKTPTRGKRKPAEAKSHGLAPTDTLGDPPADVAALAAHIQSDGGQALAVYKDPLQGEWTVLAALPLEKVERTSFQRDVSESHVDRLVDAIRRSGRFLDPVICVRDESEEHGVRYLTPNGGHRLAALTRMGARSVTALVLPDEKMVFKILALNVEKAHVLRERALEVIRMLRALARLPGQETDYAADLEDPAYATLGACYEQNGRFAGSAYHPVLKRIDRFLERSVADAVAERERRAGRLIEFEAAVAEVVSALKKKGFDSPYLRNFVVARINPLRFSRGKKADDEGGEDKGKGKDRFDEVIDKMIDKAQAFDVEKVKEADVGRTGGSSDE